MADSQELEPQLNAFAQETMHHRAEVISAAIENIARANMVNIDTDRYQRQHVVAQLATSEAVNDKELLDA